MKISIIILILTIPIELFAQLSRESILASLRNKYKLAEYDRPTEIVEFNKDTILIAGYLGDVSGSIASVIDQRKNVIYKTSDGGINWRQIKFNGDAWIYDTYHTKDGSIWMGGSDNYVYYSPDFGETWQKKPKPFNSDNRVLSIFMVNSEFGIAGGLHNGIAITQNNWQTTQLIPSPLDQNRFKITKNSARDRIERVAILDSIVLINQNEHIYFSPLDTIDWTAFNIPVLDFTVDDTNKQIHLHSLNGKGFVLSSDLNLLRTYQEDFIWEATKADSIVLETNLFFNEAIKSISLKSTKWADEVPIGHWTSDSYKPVVQKAEFVEKNNVFTFKAKGYRKNLLTFTSDKLSEVFNEDQVYFSLDQLAQNLSFSVSDLEDYLSVLEKTKAKREEEREWGGDFTSQISLGNELFSNYEAVTKNIRQNYINSIYNQLNYLFPNGNNKIEFIIVNKRNEILKVSNENSLLFSLPWTIELDSKRTKSFNPRITEFIRSILPPDFKNYEMLLGGELIFKLIEEQIIDELEYKKDY